MKVAITHLKAPWPAGAVVGQIVHFLAGMVPAWALGKCSPAEADAEVDHTVEPSTVIGKAAVTLSVDSAEVQAALSQLRDEATKHIEKIEADFAAERADLLAQVETGTQAVTDAQAKLAEAETALATLAGDKSAVEAKLAEAETALAAAATKKGKG